MRVLTVCNLKGGVGKTTTVHNLVSVFANMRPKLRVLAIDMDPQCNYSQLAGKRYPNMLQHGALDWFNMRTQKSLLEIFDELDGGEDANIARLIYEQILIAQGNPSGNFASYLTESITEITPDLHYIASHPLLLMGDRIFEQLGKSEKAFATPLQRYSVLSNILEAVGKMPVSDDRSEPYDIVLIDCNPAPGYLTNNALLAATDLLIPVTAENLAIVGSILAYYMGVSLAHEGKDWHSKSVLVTMVANTVVARESIEGIRSINPGVVLKSMIPRRVALQDALINRQPLVETDPKHPAAVAYIQAAKEIWKKIRQS